MKTFNLSILTPERSFMTDYKTIGLVFSTLTGRMGVMAGHMNMVAAIEADTVEITDPELTNEQGEHIKKIAAVGRGVSEIFPDKVIFYVDTAEWPEEIDAARAREAYLRAQEVLKHTQDNIEYTRNQLALARATARLKASGVVKI